MPNNFLKTHYAQNFQKSNFNILRIEDLFRQENITNIINNHKVDFYTLLFFSDGKGKHSIDFTDYTYSKGTILSIRKDQIHKFYLNDKTKGYLLCFKEEFLNRYLNEVEVSKSIQMFNELLTSPKTQLNDKEFRSVIRLGFGIEQEYLSLNDKYSLQIIRSLVHILITLIYRIKSKGHNKVRLSKYLNEFIRFQNLLEQEFSNTKKVCDYASMLGFSTKKLNTVVNFVVNKPAKEFINDTVIIKIKRQLLHSNLSIKEIAFRVGFNDPTNFYKYFKKNTSYTPESYRKIYKI
jgi:AraC-like DNA-binding protein